MTILCVDEVIGGAGLTALVPFGVVTRTSRSRRLAPAWSQVMVYGVHHDDRRRRGAAERHAGRAREAGAGDGDGGAAGSEARDRG